MLRISILDDENCFLNILSKEVNSILFPENIEYKIKTFHNHLAFLEYANTEKTDLLFLDIDMPDCNGIAFSKEVYKLIPDCIIIFMTFHSKYMKEAFNLNVFAFIDKAELKSRLSKTINSYLNEYLSVYQINFPTPEGNIFLAEKEIIFFEKIDRKIFIQTKHKYIQIYYKNLKDIYKLVGKGSFVYPNQSCIINLFWIHRIKNNEIYFKEIKNSQFISRRLKATFDVALMEYKGQ